MCLLLIAFGSGSNRNNAIASELLPTPDTIRSFCIIRKDSVRASEYHFEKKLLKNGVILFNYISKEDTFSVSCDTLNNEYKAKFGGNTVTLDAEKTRFYTISRKDYKVLKLVGDKDVTDGAFSLFVNPELGLLLSKSNTWRAAKILCLDKDNVLLTALLYRIQTDQDFFYDSIPNIQKFTAPKVE